MLHTHYARVLHTIYTSVFPGQEVGHSQCVEKKLVEVRTEGTPSAVMAIRTDDGVEILGGEFGKLCRNRGIKQAFASSDRPTYNGVAERALALINGTALTTRIHARVLYPGVPAYPSLWAKAVSWAYHVLNLTATTANSGDKFPYEMWYGLPSPPGRCGCSSSHSPAE